MCQREREKVRDVVSNWILTPFQRERERVKEGDWRRGRDRDRNRVTERQRQKSVWGELVTGS